MVPAWSYESLLMSLARAFQCHENRNDSTVRLVGILFAPSDSALARTEIVPSLNYFHHRSGNNIDFYCAGYRRYGYDKRSDERKVTDHEPPWYFSLLAFEGLRQEVERRSRWEYSGEADLILLNGVFDAASGEADLSWPTAVSCDLDMMVRHGAITSVRRYFESICQFSEGFDGADPAWSFSDEQGARIAGSALKRLVLSLLPKKLGDDYRKAEHFAVRDLSRSL